MPDTEQTQPTPTQALSPMLEGLLTGNIPPKDRPLHTPPKNEAEAKAQIQDMLQEHAGGNECPHQTLSE